MSTLRDDLLDIVDEIRGIPGEFGLHRYRVFVRVTTWSGSRVGQGTSTVVDTQLLVGNEDPHVKELKTQDAVAGTPEYVSGTWQIGPVTAKITPSSVIAPDRTGSPMEVHYVLFGPSMPVTGLLCQRIDDDQDRPFRNMITVRSIGRRGPP